MKISIVIPAYNVEPYIEACLASVAAQTFSGEIECIVIDDCTPDNSCAVVENFINRHKGSIDFKLLHHTENRGLSAARNTGIEAATGDYIYFLDSDDEITPDCIELLAAPLNKEKLDFVIGDYVIIGDKQGIPPLLLEHGTILKGEELRKSYFSAQWYVMAVNKLCNLEFIRKEKLYFKEGLVNEDELWSFQLACTAQSMFVIKEQTYRYIIRKSSITAGSNIVRDARTFATLTQETYSWSKERNLLSKKDVAKKILFYRKIALKKIAKLPSYKESTDLYIKCYKKIKFNTFKLYLKSGVAIKYLFKDWFYHIPRMFGYWNRCLCRKVFKG